MVLLSQGIEVKTDKNYMAAWVTASTGSSRASKSSSQQDSFKSIFWAFWVTGNACRGLSQAIVQRYSGISLQENSQSVYSCVDGKGRALTYFCMSLKITITILRIYFLRLRWEVNELCIAETKRLIHRSQVLSKHYLTVTSSVPSSTEKVLRTCRTKQRSFSLACSETSVWAKRGNRFSRRAEARRCSPSSLLERVQGVSRSRKTKNQMTASVTVFSSETIHLTSSPRASIQVQSVSISTSSLTINATAPTHLRLFCCATTVFSSPSLISSLHFSGRFSNTSTRGEWMMVRRWKRSSCALGQPSRVRNSKRRVTKLGACQKRCFISVGAFKSRVGVLSSPVRKSGIDSQGMFELQDWRWHHRVIKNAPGGDRTRDRWLIRPTLQPAELPGLLRPFCTTSYLSLPSLNNFQLNLKMQSLSLPELLSGPLAENAPSARSPSSPPPTFTTRNQLESIRTEYLRYLSSRQFSNDYEGKLKSLLEQQFCIPTSVALFEMTYYFREAIEESILVDISERAFTALKVSRDCIEQRCYSELVGQCGVATQEICLYFTEAILEGNLPFQLCLLVLTNLGQMGLAYLVDISTQSIGDISMKVLDYLSRTESVIKHVIIPLLLANLTEQTGKKREIALSALSRLNGLLSSQQTLSILRQELQRTLSDNHDPQQLIATIRASGVEGERILLQILKKRKNEQHIMLMMSVLAWRVQMKPSLHIRTIEYGLDSYLLHNDTFQYEGEIGAVDPSSQSRANLCLNARDFLMSLERTLLKQELTNGQSFRYNLEHSDGRDQSFRRQASSNGDLFILKQIIIPEEQRVQISQEIVKALGCQLGNQSAKVREAALLQLGNIGIPEGYHSAQKIGRCLEDSDSNVRCAACWALSKVISVTNSKLSSRLTDLLRDTFWKVRTAACIAIGLLVRQPTQALIAALLKALTDGSIKRSTVCETIVKIGPIGEQLLLQLLRAKSPCDFKLKEAIIGSLRWVDVDSQQLDSVIEQLLRQCKDHRLQIRELCFTTLNALRERLARAGNEVSYFQAKNILPFYYHLLDDQSVRIRKLAAQCLLSFGSQAQLVFIDGIIRGSAVVKMESVRALGVLGVQNFRGIVLALRDEDPRVVRIAEETIMGCFQPNTVAQYYSEQSNQSLSLVCNLKETLVEMELAKPVILFLRDLIVQLEGHYQ